MDRSELEQRVRASTEARIVKHAATQLFKEGFAGLDLGHRFNPRWQAFGTSLWVHGPDPRWDWLEDAPAPGEVNVLNVAFGFTAASLSFCGPEADRYKNFCVAYADPDYPARLLLRVEAELATHLLRLEADREEYRLFAADCRRRGVVIIEASDIPHGRFGSCN